MRHAIHKMIVWYLRRCWGAFHAYPYGPAGRYVVLMTDGQFGRWKKYESDFRKAPTPVTVEKADGEGRR